MRRTWNSRAESKSEDWIASAARPRRASMDFGSPSSIGTGPDARAATWFDLTEQPGRWHVRQVLDDPEGWHDTAIIAEVDLAASDEAGSPAWRTLQLERG